MRFFCKPYSVCATCKVHFEPAPTERHAELCPEHRKPVVELEDRILRVTDWAKRNWEKLEPQVLKEEAKRTAASNAALQKLYRQMQPVGSQQGAVYSGLGQAAGLSSPYGHYP